MFGNSNKENYPLHKLKLDYTLTLFKTDWKIIEIGEYDWDMDNSSIEYTLQSAHKKAYLEVEFIKGNYEIIYSEEATIDEAFLTDAIREGVIYFEGKEYELEETYTGQYKNPNTFTRRETLESFLFYYKDDILTIEKWDDGTYEAFLGEEIKAKKIKNIKAN
jgi:hypothetical protein